MPTVKHHATYAVFIFLYQSKSGVEKYLSAVSGRTVTTVFPLPSLFASFIAAATFVPLLIPQSIPSLAARSFATDIASSSVMIHICEMISRLSIAGITPSPMPICTWVPMSPPERIAAFSGSAAQIVILGFAAFNASPIPVMVPPVPIPDQNPWIAPSTASSISLAVAER